MLTHCVLGFVVFLHLPVAGSTGRKGTVRKSTNTSFFIASDKALLDIMRKEGMGCYVDIMQLQRGAKVGINSFVTKLIMSAVVKSATISLFSGETNDNTSTQCQHLGRTGYTHALPWSEDHPQIFHLL